MDTRKSHACTCFACAEKRRLSSHPTYMWIDVTAVVLFVVLGIANLV